MLSLADWVSCLHDSQMPFFLPVLGMNVASSFAEYVQTTNPGWGRQPQALDAAARGQAWQMRG